MHTRGNRSKSDRGEQHVGNFLKGPTRRRYIPGILQYNVRSCEYAITPGRLHGWSIMDLHMNKSTGKGYAGFGLAIWALLQET